LKNGASSSAWRTFRVARFLSSRFL